MAEKLFPEPFLKNQISAFFGSIVSSFIEFALIECQVDEYQNILKLGCKSITFNSNKAFIKKKKKERRRALKLAFLPYLLTKLHFLCAFPSSILGMCIVCVLRIYGLIFL